MVVGKLTEQEYVDKKWLIIIIKKPAEVMNGVKTG